VAEGRVYGAVAVAAAAAVAGRSVAAVAARRSFR